MSFAFAVACQLLADESSVSVIVKNTFVEVVRPREGSSSRSKSWSSGHGGFLADISADSAKKSRGSTQPPKQTYLQSRHGSTSTEASVPPAASGQPADAPGVVTLMIRHVPRGYTQSGLKQEFDAAGFQGCYDFFYLPLDEKHKRNRGFAFMNFADSSLAAQFYKMFHGIYLKCYRAQNPLTILPADVQGLPALTQHFASQQSRHHGDNGQPLFLPLLRLRAPGDATQEGECAERADRSDEQISGNGQPSVALPAFRQITATANSLEKRRQQPPFRRAVARASVC